MKIEFRVALTTEAKPILQEEILHRGPQARRINLTTTLLVARARIQTWSHTRMYTHTHTHTADRSASVDM